MTIHRIADSRSANDEPTQGNVPTAISVVVPTYREAENIPLLIERLSKLRSRYNGDVELLIMDDDSNDGSIEAVQAAGQTWVRIIVRNSKRGLGPSVIDGFCAAKYPILICMDADLSHPPEKIPDLIRELEAGHRIVLGSRYVSGGATDERWGLFRWLNSRVATLLARPLTRARDPMSGFFAMRKSDFEQARHLNPIGYKIALELIVKCHVDDVGEVPIHFSNRRHGESKLTIREVIKYLQHLRELYIYKFGDSIGLGTDQESE
jgi:dolichol-phosphate mannosyltransferase